MSLNKYSQHWIGIVNSLTPKSVPAGTKNSRSKGFWLAKHRTQTSPPWWSRFPLQRNDFDGRAYPNPGSLRGRGWTRLPSKGFSRINKIKEKKIYFFALCVNYNNRSPAVGNDSQNGINCRRRVAIIYELTNNILTNNTIAQLYFIMTIIMLFSYGYARQIIINRKKCSWFAGHFDGHADQGVRCQAYCPVRQV